MLSEVPSRSLDWAPVGLDRMQPQAEVDAWLVVDGDGRLRQCGPALAAWLGTEAPRLAGVSLAEFGAYVRRCFVQPSAILAALQNWLAAPGRVVHLDARLAAPPRDLILRLGPFGEPEAAAPALLVTILDITSATERARADERDRIALALHDEIIQVLYGVSLKLVAGEREERGIEGLRAAIRAAAREVDGVLTALRGTIHDLRDGAGPAGLTAEIERLAREFERATGLRPELTIDPRVGVLLAPSRCRLAVAIVREALTNVRRHAAARGVWVSAMLDGAAIAVAVRDDGRGFDVAAAAEPGRYGLGIMRERAAQAGAALSVAGLPGGGTEVRLVLPMEREGAEAWTGGR
jgi:signal transduction histidine kinase